MGAPAQRVAGGRVAGGEAERVCVWRAGRCGASCARARRSLGEQGTPAWGGRLGRDAVVVSTSASAAAAAAALAVAVRDGGRAWWGTPPRLRRSHWRRCCGKHWRLCGAGAGGSMALRSGRRAPPFASAGGLPRSSLGGAEWRRGGASKAVAIGVQSAVTVHGCLALVGRPRVRDGAPVSADPYSTPPPHRRDWRRCPCLCGPAARRCSAPTTCYGPS